jgi:FlaG/FlaF family flagellin (archaellin)
LRAAARARRIRGVAPRHLSLLAVVFVLAATPAVAGCGGGEDESASEQWAGEVCTELSTWVADVEEAVRSLTENPLSLDTSAVQAATEDVSEATAALVDELAELERPETEAGEQARSEIDKLATELQQQIDDVEQAAASGSLSLVDITTSLAAASAAVKSSFESIQSLDGGEELRDGFEDAAACDSLQQQVDTIGD